MRWICFIFLLFLPSSVLADAYYFVNDVEKAKAEAQTKHLPIAWMSSYPEALQDGGTVGSDFELTQMSLQALKGRAVIIFQKGNEDDAATPPFVLDELHQMDDGPMPGGHHYYCPKIIFTDPTLTLYLDRTFHTELKVQREGAIESVFNRLRSSPSAQAALRAVPPATQAPSSASQKTALLADSLLPDFSGWILYAIGTVVVLGLAMGGLVWLGRSSSGPPRSAP